MSLKKKAVLSRDGVTVLPAEMSLAATPDRAASVQRAAGRLLMVVPGVFAFGVGRSWL